MEFSAPLSPFIALLGKPWVPWTRWHKSFETLIAAVELSVHRYVAELRVLACLYNPKVRELLLMYPDHLTLAKGCLNNIPA